ncbi:hypothetical protein CPB86DRAFT_873806 [Serendipita vermifera]|nr:hypothetical protein CPB86DRAFT_873806 [Serendipita vermifera]
MNLNLFDTLADELVLEILRYLHKNPTELRGTINRDVWNLSLCSHRLRRIGLPLLYHTVHIENAESMNRFLQIMLKHPNKSNLVKSLGLGPAVWPPPPFQMDPLPDQIDLKEEAQKLSLSSVLIKYIERRTQWANVLLLLHRLQALEGLFIDTDTHNMAYFEEHFSNSLKSGLLSPILRAYTRCADPASSYYALIPAFLAPSMVKVCGIRVDPGGASDFCRYLLLNTELESFYGTSGVERFELHYAHLSSEDLSGFLRLPRALKMLVYKGEGRRNPGQDHVLNEFRQALDFVARTLEFLEFDWYDVSRVISGAKNWSFHNFVSLKVLHIKFILMYGTDPTRAPCIAGSLPPNLEELALYLHYTSKWKRVHYIETWTNLLEKKSFALLPHLRLIAHYPQFTVLDSIYDLATRKNVKIALKWDDLTS